MKLISFIWRNKKIGLVWKKQNKYKSEIQRIYYKSYLLVWLYFIMKYYSEGDSVTFNLCLIHRSVLFYAIAFMLNKVVT